MGLTGHVQETSGMHIAGRIKLFLNNWKVVTKDQWVLQTVQGAEIEFSQNPYQQIKPHPLSLPIKDRECLEEEVQKLMEKGAVVEIPSWETQNGFFSNVFLVPKKDGNMRPVINLKTLNQYVLTDHFKMEGLHTVRDLLRHRDWLTKIDLKDAYFTIPIATQHQRYLCFTVEDHHFQFTCLPFGLSSAPRVFTKTIKPVTTLLRELGVRMVQYLDDFLIMAASPHLAKEHTTALIYLLENLGFIVHPGKSITQPTQSLEFLGMILDTQRMELQVPGAKLKKIRTEANNLLRAETVTARDVSRIVGKMSSMSQAIPPAPLFYRSLQRDLSRALEYGNQAYDVNCALSKESRRELQWWITHLEQWNGKSLLTRQPDVIIESDASLRGWGAVSNGVRTGGPWSPEESQYHINCLEILAAKLAVRSFLKNKSNLSVLILMDNTTAVAYLNHMGGTVAPLATEIAKELWMWCLQEDITLRAQHLPGKENIIADEESRVRRDRSDWRLNPKIFQRIQEILGPVHLDLFASRLTAQLPKFFSWRPDPLATATDALLQDWERMRAYANPPWSLIGRVLTKARTTNASLILLVAPVWPSQPWYPTLLELLVDFPRLLPQWQDLILQVEGMDLPEILPQLAVWPISPNDLKQKNFQKELRSSSWHPGDRRQPSHMTRCFRDGFAGVRNGTQIPFRDL